jgi:uncharacterized protein (DUF934 family)
LIAEFIMKNTIKLIAAYGCPESENDSNVIEIGSDKILRLANDADPRDSSLNGIDRVELHFPKFSDGRAYSQAVVLRKRMGFAGDIRATGDVLADQVVQMQRLGFSSAVLRADQSLNVAQRQFDHFAQFYQGDITLPAPLFARQEQAA